MSAPLVLGIAGSPRRGGNSDRLLESALAGAREAGARTDTLVASESGIEPCTGCNSCSVDGECVQIDGGRELYDAIDSADAIIVSSPVFFATVPSGLKAVYDRMQPYWARTHVLGQPRPACRPGAILLVRGGGDPYGFDCAEAVTRSVFAVLGIDVLGTVAVTGVDGSADMDTHLDALEEAKNLGRAVAEGAAGRAVGR
ncbi:MAG: flavodoxin family protein [Coriobacteriia bacterium]|nr:flavodoxin family protein [Coriobacteriia bacterium]